MTFENEAALGAATLSATDDDVTVHDVGGESEVLVQTYTYPNGRTEHRAEFQDVEAAAVLSVTMETSTSLVDSWTSEQTAELVADLLRQQES